MRTWLLVAAERREFDGILKRAGNAAPLAWPGVKFAHEVRLNNSRWWLVANGPGEALVEAALREERNVEGIVSTGLCGALDPALRVGDIVVSGGRIAADAPFTRGEIHSANRVVVSSREKRELRNRTGAVAVDMEAAAVERAAARWRVPFFCIRAVSDTAGQNLPLDFNRYRDARGDFSRARIALAAMARPFSVLAPLIEFDRDCRRAAECLGEFFAHCEF